MKILCLGYSEPLSPAGQEQQALLQRRSWSGLPAASWRLLAGACVLHRGRSIQRCTHGSTGGTTRLEQA